MEDEQRRQHIVASEMIGVMLGTMATMFNAYGQRLKALADDLDEEVAKAGITRRDDG